MIRFALLTLAVAFAVVAAGLVFGWGFWIFDDFGWQRHWAGWLCLSLGALAAWHHPVVDAVDDWLDRLKARERSRP